MGAINLKKDLQEAIANSVMDFWADYKSLIFDKNNAEEIQSFFFFEEINVKAETNRLLYHMKLNPNILKIFNSEEIENIKRINEINKKLNITNNNFLEQLNELIINNENEDDIDERPIVTKEQLRKMQNIQRILKNKFNIDVKLKYGNVFLSLECNKEAFCFDKDMIILLGYIFQQVDVLAIVPHFNDNGAIDNVRLFIGLDLLA